jgi:hypothetical protein
LITKISFFKKGHAFIWGVVSSNSRNAGKMKKLFLIFFIIVGCNRGAEPDKNIGRIVIDDNIDGVRLGDESLAAILKLGYPHSIVFPATPTIDYAYEESIHANTSVGIRYGDGVIQIAVSRPYPGKTCEGIGIGSGRSFVISKLGNPTEDIPDYNRNHERYIFENSVFVIDYDNDFIQYISMVSKNEKPIKKYL